MLVAARWLVIAKGIETVVAIMLGAPMNMYVATERMALSNFWIVVQRCCPIVAALFVILVQGIEEPVEGLQAFAVISASLFILVLLIAVCTIVIVDNRLIPRIQYIGKSALKELLHIGGWNAVAVTSLGMHIRIDNLLMNLFFLMPGSLIYGFTSQLTSYVRMLAMGVSYGLDAVSTRVSTRKGEDAVSTLCTHITRLNSTIALPAAAALFVLAGPILTLWVGDRMEHPEIELPLTIVLVRIMCIGMAIRALTDGWIKIMVRSRARTKICTTHSWGCNCKPNYCNNTLFITTRTDSIYFCSYFVFLGICSCEPRNIAKNHGANFRWGRTWSSRTNYASLYCNVTRNGFSLASNSPN